MPHTTTPSKIIHMCDIWFICVAYEWVSCISVHHTRDMTHAYVWHGARICVTWLLHMCDISHMYHMLTLQNRHICGLIHVCGMANSCMWLFFYRALLQRRPIILRSLLIVAIQYHSKQTHSCVCHGCCIYLTWLIHTCHTTLLQNIVSFIGLFCKRDV